MYKCCTCCGAAGGACCAGAGGGYSGGWNSAGPYYIEGCDENSGAGGGCFGGNFEECCCIGKDGREKKPQTAYDRYKDKSKRLYSNCCCKCAPNCASCLINMESKRPLLSSAISPPPYPPPFLTTCNTPTMFISKACGPPHCALQYR